MRTALMAVWGFLLLVLVTGSSSAAYTDNFNRTNESPIRGNWVTWDFGLGRMELYNNQVRSTDTNPYNVWARRTSEPYSANHYSQIKLTSAPSGEVGGPAVRVQLNGSEINGYIFTVLNSTTAAIWVRYSSVPDTWQQVGTNFTGTFASGDVYKLEIKGNVLTVYRNGVSLGTRTDTSNRIPSGGAAGMSIVNPGTWDDWQGGDVVPPPTVSDLTPDVATVGGSAFTLTVTGNNFLSGAKVRWNGMDRVTTFLSTTQLQASITAADIATPGTVPVTVLNPDGGVSNTINFQVWGPAPVVTGLSPSYATAGGAAFTLTVSGSNFLSGAKVRWNGADRVTTFVSATQLRASILVADIAATGTIPVTVLNPDGGLSNAIAFTIWAPPPTVMSLSPSVATVGGSAFTLTVTGTNFVSGAKVRWNGSDRTTTFVSATQLRASILVADIAATGTIPVTVLNPDGGLSNTMSFVVRILVSAPTVTSLSPTFATSGDAAFTLTVSGTNFVSGAKVRWNGSDRTTTFVTTTQLQASIAAADIATPGMFPVTVLNSDGGLSNAMNFTVWGPAPVVTGLSPSFATAGGAAFTLTVSGTNFVSGAKVQWNGSDRVTTYVSATQLQAGILAADIATAGAIPVTVLNPDGSVSNTISFDVRVPVSTPAVTGLTPSVATAGGAAFPLTVTGTNFVSGSKVRWNGSDRVTTFVSVTQLQASILAADITTAGAIPVTVLNPDGGLSNAMTFDVLADVSAYTDNFNRTNESPIRGNWVTWDFGLGRMELYNNQVRSTDTNPYNVWARRTSEPYSANHYSQIKLTSAPSGEVGGPAVRVQLNGSEINGYIFTVLNSTTAAIWVRYSSVPDTWQQVGTNFTGTFASGDVYKLEIKGNVLTVYRNGVSLGTRTDTSNRIPSGGAAGMSIVNPGTWDDWQGGDTIETSSPAISGISPTFVIAGGPAFTLTVSGSNFVSGSKVRWNGSDRVTTFVSATELRAAILAADVATAGSAPVTVFNPDGSLSNAMTFEIRGLQPAIISLSPSWGTAGGPSFTLIVDGSNFISGSKVRWKGSDRVTSFISGTELQASISAADIASAGTAGVTVYTPPPGGGTSNAINFDILAVLTALGVNPSSVVGGSPSTGTVTLSGPAPAGGAVVSLAATTRWRRMFLRA